MYGLYKGIIVCVHYDSPETKSDQYIIPLGSSDYMYDCFMDPKMWHGPIWLGTRHPRGDPRHAQLNPLFKWIASFQKRWRKQRAKRRIALYKEDLMAVTWHPKRVERWLNAGIAPEDM